MWGQFCGLADKAFECTGGRGIKLIVNEESSQYKIVNLEKKF